MGTRCHTVYDDALDALVLRLVARSEGGMSITALRAAVDVWFNDEDLKASLRRLSSAKKVFFEDDGKRSLRANPGPGLPPRGKSRRSDTGGAV